jgi:F-type H+-transporting ATPase subunit delta
MAAVTSRYARAFVDAVFDLKLDSTKVTEDLHSVLSLTRENPQLHQVWDNPSIPAEQKRNLLDALCGRLGLVKYVRNFLAVLIDHHRMGMLPEIVSQFEHELHERLGFAEAEIVSARELAEQQRRELELQISQMTGKRVLAKYAIDAKLLGGAMVRIGSTIYDGSVRGQLQKLREELANS